MCLSFPSSSLHVVVDFFLSPLVGYQKHVSDTNKISGRNAQVLLS